MTDKKVIEKKPGEKPEGEFHYNPGNMAGKKAKTSKEVGAENATTDQRKQHGQKTPLDR
jgi:hypothetical protein